MTTAQTAHEALERYSAALDADLLIQGDWHKEDNGRYLVCALGVIGDDVKSTRACPAQVMPRWLAQQVVWFFDGQDFADAKTWGLRFYQQIDRLNGLVPFSVVHDWQASVVGQLAVEMAEKGKRNVEAHIALAAMQAEAAAGKNFTPDGWRPVLRAAFLDANANAYANAYAYAYANAYADADAYANAYAYADANANAYADADAYAYANADAYANAYANADAKKAVIKRLADGMIDCLARVTV